MDPSVLPAPFTEVPVRRSLTRAFSLPAGVVNEPVRQKMFQQFANTTDVLDNVERITNRSQPQPAEWPKDFPSVRLTRDDIAAPVTTWRWEQVASRSDLMPSTEGVTSAAIKWGDTQLAIFDVPGRGLYGTQQMCGRSSSRLFSCSLTRSPQLTFILIRCPHKVSLFRSKR